MKKLLMCSIIALWGTPTNAITLENDTDHEMTFIFQLKKPAESDFTNMELIPVKPHESVQHSMVFQTYTDLYQNGGIMRITTKAEGIPDNSCQVDGKTLEYVFIGKVDRDKFAEEVRIFNQQTLKYSSPEKGAWWNAVCTLVK